MTAPRKTHRITLIPGDGIGPEVSGAVVNVLEAAGAAEMGLGRRSLAQW